MVGMVCTGQSSTLLLMLRKAVSVAKKYKRVSRVRCSGVNTDSICEARAGTMMVVTSLTVLCIMVDTPQNPKNLFVLYKQVTVTRTETAGPTVRYATAALVDAAPPNNVALAALIALRSCLSISP